MLNDTNECEWVIKNKIPTSFLEDLYKVRRHFTGGNDVFCITCERVFDFMKIIHETYEKYYELTPKEIHSEKQKVNEVPSID